MKTQRFKAAGGNPRPVCTLCGKFYGTRHTETVQFRVAEGEPVPRYAGNLMLVTEESYPTSNTTVVEGQRSLVGAQIERFTAVTRTLWDGNWWKPYEPFCTLRCALSFAQASHAAGHRFKLRQPKQAG